MDTTGRMLSAYQEQSIQAARPRVRGIHVVQAAAPVVGMLQGPPPPKHTHTHTHAHTHARTTHTHPHTPARTCEKAGPCWGTGRADVKVGEPGGGSSVQRVDCRGLDDGVAYMCSSPGAVNLLHFPLVPAVVSKCEGEGGVSVD